MNDEELIDAVFEKIFPEQAKKFTYKRKIRLILEQVYQEMPSLEELRQEEDWIQTNLPYSERKKYWEKT